MPADKTGKLKLAVITGGGSGMGLAMARTFAGNGYAVVITGRDANRLKNAIKQFGSDQTHVSAIPCNVRDPASVEKLFQEIGKHYSAVDVLINNAGVAHTLAPVEKLPID